MPASEHPFGACRSDRDPELCEACERSLASDIFDATGQAQRIAVLEGVIERDRSTLAGFVTALNKEFDSRFWLTEGRGSYEWNDDRYRQEFHDAVLGIKKILEPIARMAADLTNSPKTTAEVVAARRDLEAENASLRQNVTALEAEVAQLAAAINPNDPLNFEDLVELAKDCRLAYDKSVEMLADQERLEAEVARLRRELEELTPSAAEEGAMEAG